jgi:leucyl-tRNA synthetase
MADYNFKNIESKWQKYWSDNKTFETLPDDKKQKYYCLVMLPYPSGNLHMGHVRNYSIGDVLARFHRAKGLNVIHPMGWDAFGMPAENAAIKNKIHPGVWTKQNIARMREQLKALGISYDWSREIASCNPDYYKWNQWFFIKMFEKGLVTRKSSNVNWCPQCATVLANEQASDGVCWRCKTEVEQKELEQWFIKITDYADELLSGHNELKGWPEQVIAMQKNWIGKSYGAEVDFKIAQTDEKLTVFTTRPDTLFGVSFMAVAPEHEIIQKLKQQIKNYAEVEKYIRQSAKKSNLERTSNKEKSGVKLEGISVINPVNGGEVPVFAADYILKGYGTGAIMAVPAHDARDWEFAKKYNLAITEVIKGENSDITKAAFEGEGVMVNSAQFDGLVSKDALSKVSNWVEEKGFGKKTVNFKLKDWLVSRQRYWGTPIPMVYCNKCGIVPEKLENLPVLLPEDVEFTGTGESPLKTSKNFVDTTCPKCGAAAKRETDTMDTFVDSSWYYARYTDPKNDKLPFETDIYNYWMPVDQYIGGIEHATMHLIYSRFWHKVMRDFGMSKYNEPFTNLLTQGMVTLGGSAMSKSRGNTVSPDEIVEKYGADTARLFILFAAPPQKQLDWSTDGLEGCYRFINRVWRLADIINGQSADSAPENEKGALTRKMHQTIKKVTSDIAQEKQFNTAISAIMELVNAMYAYKHNDDTFKEVYKTLLKLLAPFTPHLCEELWSGLGKTENISTAQWPSYDEKMIKTDKTEIPVQLNGKIKGKIFVTETDTQESVKSIMMQDEKLKSALEGKEIIKFIYVKNKIVNVVVK